jgi:5-(carboxyamino)imidazole ribonucleotide synthase
VKLSFQPILPGSVIGVLGSGQLGRMFAISARRMGYRVHTFSPESDTPTGQVADLEIGAAYDDLEAVRSFARAVDVVTFEFENVPAATAQAAAECAPVRPSGSILHITQNRLREKSFLASHSFPVTPFRAVSSSDDLKAGLAEFGYPAVLKTAGFGYDGKGQTRINSFNQAAAALQEAGGRELILESFVDFACELSVVAARGMDGAFSHWGVIENIHRNHILDLSIAPAQIEPKIWSEAIEIARAVLEKLDVIGALCVEFFLTGTGELLINELAPRPHNSGHLTFDACVTSQFEQQLRAVCGLPLGSTELLRPAAMANLLGDLWQDGEPNWRAAAAFPEVKLHLYGKLSPKPGRKMGHLTAMADTPQAAADLVRASRQALKSSRQ